MPKEASGNYAIVLVGAKVQKGTDGDDPPDVYVNKGSFGGLAIARTKTVENALTATWNAPIGTLPAKEVVGASITIEIKDDDFGGDDLIGTCTHTVQQSEVDAGKVQIPQTDCVGRVDAVEFRITPAK